MNPQKRPSWGGKKAAAIRAEMAKLVALEEPLCPRCGQPVTTESGFQADHWPIPRTDLPVSEWYNPARLVASHPYCNMKAGGTAEMRRRHGWKKPTGAPPDRGTPGLRRCEDPTCTVILASQEPHFCPRHARGPAA